MTAIALLLLVILSSLTITRIAAIVLELTGMSRDSARFQARAAYCGVGYATREAESVVGHPVRRRVISLLMLLGNAGTATVVATLIMSFTGSDQGWLAKLGILIVGLTLLAAISSSTWADQLIRQWTLWIVQRYTHLDLNDYVAVLHVEQGYAVSQLEAAPGDWIGGRDLAELALPSEGVLVLGVQRGDGKYVGAPSGKTTIQIGDTLTLYGKLERIEELNRRRTGPSGVFAHAAAIGARKREQEEHVGRSGPGS